MSIQHFSHLLFSKIKTQEVKLIEYETPLKSDQQKTDMGTLYEGFELDRNVPIYDSFSNIKGLSHVKFAATDANILLERNLPEYQTHSNLTSGERKFNMIHKDIELERNMPEYQLFSNVNGGGMKKISVTPDKEMILDRNLPEYQVRSNMTSGTKISFVHDDIVLERNVPEYDSFSNISGNKKVEFIHNDIELSRVLPEHEAQTNHSENRRKTLLHEKMKEYERKAILSQMSTNDSKKGEMNRNNATEYTKLQDKLQAGEFVNSGFVPTVGRTQEMNVRIGENSKNLRVRRE